MLLKIVGVSEQVEESYQAVVREQASTLAHRNLGIFEDNSPSEADRKVLTTELTGAVTQIATQWVLEDFETPAETVIRNAVAIWLAVSCSRLDD